MSRTSAERQRRYRDRKRGGPPRHVPAGEPWRWEMECRWLAKALADAGRHLTEIRQQRLYKHGGHATFAAYLREVGIGRADARRFMALHEVAEQKRAEAAAGGAPAGEDAAGQG